MDQNTISNRLLRRLPPPLFDEVAEHLTFVAMPKGFTLAVPDDSFEHAFFIEDGLGSIITASADCLEAESGIFGWDGFSPASMALGADRSPHRIVMQVGGNGLRLPAATMRHLIDVNPVFRSLLLRYAHVLFVQTAYTALSNAVHPVDERLARWLLMCHDRVEGNELPLTHEFLSIMLAVRRPSVTTSLHVLEGNRFITTERGNVIIRNRQRLEEFAGDAYGRPEAEERRLFETAPTAAAQPPPTLPIP